MLTKLIRAMIAISYVVLCLGVVVLVGMLITGIAYMAAVAPFWFMFWILVLSLPAVFDWFYKRRSKSKSSECNCYADLWGRHHHPNCPTGSVTGPPL